MATRIAVGDAKQQLRLIGSESINCVVTSPPYWMKRNYNAGPDEIGREPTFQVYIDHLLEVMDEAYRILSPIGTLWLNLGDTYITQGGNSRGTYYPETGRIRNVGNGELLIKSHELPRKSLCLLPYRVAIAMQERGWIVRNVLVWWKPDGLPENVRDRFTVDFEPIFLFTKSPDYYFRQQLRPYSESTIKRCESFNRNGEAFDPTRHKVDPSRPSQSHAILRERVAKRLSVPSGAALLGSNMRSVWPIATAHYRGSHCAVFPEQFAEICIDAGCPPGGTVLDPFLGSGTVAVVAERLGRDCYGIELNPQHAQEAKDRILAARTDKS